MNPYKVLEFNTLLSGRDSDGVRAPHPYNLKGGRFVW